MNTCNRLEAHNKSSCDCIPDFATCAANPLKLFYNVCSVLFGGCCLFDCVCVRACVHARARACVRAGGRACVRVCACVCVCVDAYVGVNTKLDVTPEHVYLLRIH